ncbi:hypothetical protein HA402_004071 [Bradysia odoriphaga]|nr:hypothetical protein HA402_004071 [Bradysia odoriphaga]
MPFNLTHLSLLNMRLQESPNDYNNLLKFMKPHAKTLKVLELGRYFPSFVFEFVFANMTKLQTISMMMTEIPNDKDFHERLDENRNIKNLIFSNSGGFNDETDAFERTECVGFWNDCDEQLPHDESDDDDDNGWMAGAGMLAPFDLNLMGIDFDYDDVNADIYEFFNAAGWDEDDDDSDGHWDGIYGDDEY